MTKLAILTNHSKHIKIQLPDQDECDIDLVFPNGKIMSLQYRLESPSIDICMEEELSVTNWKGDDMEPADPLQEDAPHIRNAKQLVIDFPPEWLDEEDTKEEKVEQQRRDEKHGLYPQFDDPAN